MMTQQTGTDPVFTGGTYGSSCQIAPPSRLHFYLPLPPTDNALISKTGGYPTRAYKDWLDHAVPLLDDQIEEQGGAPQCDGWWMVEIIVWIGRQDGANFTKAILDLLSGRRRAPSTMTVAGANGRERKVSKGDLITPPECGVWRDDNRVGRLFVTVAAVRCRDEDQRCEVRLTPVGAPLDWAAMLESKARAEKAAEKAAAAAARYPRACGTCGAAVGQPCRTASGNPRKEHDGR